MKLFLSNGTVKTGLMVAFVLCGGFTVSFSANAGNPLCRDLFVAQETQSPSQQSLGMHFRHSIARKLQEQLSELLDKSENLRDAIKRMISIEDVAAQNAGQDIAPKMSASTRHALLRAYGEKSQFDFLARQALIDEAQLSLKADPYFNWLVDQRLRATVTTSKTDYSVADGKPIPVSSPRDPVAYLLWLLNRSDRLPLDLAILKTRQEFDPSLHAITQSSIGVLLDLFKQQKALEWLMERVTSNNHFSISAEAWSRAETLEAAIAARAEIRRHVRHQAQNRFPRSVYEKMREQFLRDNPELEIVRRYILSQPGGIYFGKLAETDVRFLENEAQRIHSEWGLGSDVVFDRAFLSLWPMMWGQNLSYEVILLRAFFQGPEAQKLEHVLRDLDLIVETSLALKSDGNFYDFLMAQTRY